MMWVQFSSLLRDRSHRFARTLDHQGRPVDRPGSPGDATDRPFRVVKKFLIGKDLDASKMGVERADRLINRFLGHVRLRRRMSDEDCRARTPGLDTDLLANSQPVFV